jgi:hypothetical protein
MENETSECVESMSQTPATYPGIAVDVAVVIVKLP